MTTIETLERMRGELEDEQLCDAEEPERYETMISALTEAIDALRVKARINKQEPRI